MGALDGMVKAAHRTGVEYTEADVNSLAGGVGEVSMSVDAEGDTAVNTIRLSINVKDKNSNPFTGAIDVLINDSADVLDVAATPPAGAVATNAGVILHSPVAKSISHIVPDATGLIELDVTETGAKSFFPYVVLPDGQRVQGPTMTYA